MGASQSRKKNAPPKRETLLKDNTANPTLSKVPPKISNVSLEKKIEIRMGTMINSSCILLIIPNDIKDYLFTNFFTIFRIFCLRQICTDFYQYFGLFIKKIITVTDLQVLRYKRVKEQKTKEILARMEKASFNSMTTTTLPLSRVIAANRPPATPVLRS